MKINAFLLKITLVTCSCVVSHAISAGGSVEYLLTDSSAPHSLSYLPPPPLAKSASFSKDKDAYHHGYTLKGTKRWRIAAKDADDSSVQTLADRFTQAFGHKISEIETPYTYRIIQEIKHDSSFVTKSAKSHYMRVRPFVYFNKNTCKPDSESGLRVNGAYPSGHTTQGWAVALALSEVNPSRQEAILSRGYEYGYSRVVCGAHWQSDVDAGYVTGSALMSRLNAHATFRTWVKKAQKELVTSSNLAAHLKSA